SGSSSAFPARNVFDPSRTDRSVFPKGERPSSLLSNTMRLRWLACAAIFSGAFGCGSSPDGTALDRAHQCPAGATCMVGAGGGPETGGAVIGAGGIIPFGSGGAAGSSMGGVSGFLSTGGDSFSTGGAGLPDGSI